MSAGICIMNKNAIAMAADSAVTIGQHIAIHNSANKLFALSRYEPVGVIIYANASFMQIPIEIIIKQYKSYLSKKKFNSLEDYVLDFINYLEVNTTLFRFDKNEATYVKSVYIDFFNGMVGNRKRLIENKLKEVSRELTLEELLKINNETLNIAINVIERFPILKDDVFTQYIEDTYLDEIKKYIDSNFDWISRKQSESLAGYVCRLYNKNFFRDGYVGMAFAGFGIEDIFPQMVHLHLGGIINGKLRYFKKSQVSINENNDASITPLAQTDVMQTFLFGINNEFINKIASEIPYQISQRINSVDDNCFANGKKKIVIRELNESTKEILNEVIKKANQEFMQPILQSVATLPIEELSLFAESMINITSVRRKVALDGNIGTVGGPIDVAIISKHDGFIWMKRKHYFDIKYNPQYMYTHYAENLKMYEGVNDGQ